MGGSPAGREPGGAGQYCGFTRQWRAVSTHAMQGKAQQRAKPHHHPAKSGNHPGRGRTAIAFFAVSRQLAQFFCQKGKTGHLDGIDPCRVHGVFLHLEGGYRGGSVIARRDFTFYRRDLRVFCFQFPRDRAQVPAIRGWPMGCPACFCAAVQGLQRDFSAC